MKNNLTQKELKKHLNYNPKTGVFTRKIAMSNRVKVGDITGCVTKLGYLFIMINSKSYLAHRLAWLYMYGTFPKILIDHINHNRGDNRILNLREVTHQENHQNENLRVNNKSGIMGVYWSKGKKRFQSEIKVNRKKIYLGSTKDFFEACCTRKSAENKYNFHENHGNKIC